jgi:outer membrane protein assembly factor BamA
MPLSKYRLFFLCISLFILLYISVLPTQASIDDEFSEMSERAHITSSMNQKKQGAWLPVPIPVSNPTIGTGLQAVLLYLHPKNSTDPTAPNATSGMAAIYTDTDSWFFGGFHDDNWKNDLYRFKALAGTGKFNLDYFGIGDDSALKDNPIPYSISTDMLFSQLLRRFPGSQDWYFGARYAYIRSNVIFDTEENPELPAISDDAITSSLGLIINYDSRDNNYYPAEGGNFEFAWSINDETIGSDFNFRKLSTSYDHYFSVTNKSVIALRAYLSDANGNVPFYLLPTLRLRGFPAGRYKDNSLLSGHTEWRHKPVPRWGYVLFFEAGNVADNLDNIFDTETITAYGGGIRWQVTEDKLLNLGLDVGFSKDDYAIYVNIGERF